MLLRRPSAPSPDPDADLIEASTFFRERLAAFQFLAEIVDSLEDEPSCQHQVTALQRLAGQLLMESRRLAGDIIATPAQGSAGRRAKAAALRVYLERVGDQPECIETAWALSLVNDELGDATEQTPVSRPPRQRHSPKLLLAVGSAALAAVAWRAHQNVSSRRTSARSACPRSQPGSPA